MSVPTVLENILARKVEEVAERRARVSLAELEDRPSAVDFRAAWSEGGLAFFTRSPYSSGVIFIPSRSLRYSIPRTTHAYAPLQI